MRVSATKTALRVERNFYATTWKIKKYGADNNYPQKVLEILNSSGTGLTCFDIYTKFIVGAGFEDKTLSETFLNPKERSNAILKKCAKDLKAFKGFALLIKYNGALEQDSIYNVPFEHCRQEVNELKQLTGRIAIHPDWTGINGLTFRVEDIRYLNVYNPLTVRKEMKAEKGPQGYLGQVYYFTSDGDFEYPVSSFDPIITDMLTEESCSTVKHRNAKYNFLPGGLLLRKGKRPHVDADYNLIDDRYNRDLESSRNEIIKMQGDENACKLWVVDIDTDEEKPEFVPFQTRSLDKEYTYTEKSVQDNIGRMFIVPPILRGVDIGAGFGADLLINAYNFMNSIVEEERNALKVVFMDILSKRFTDFEILPLEYKITQPNANAPISSVQ